MLRVFRQPLLRNNSYHDSELICALKDLKATTCWYSGYLEGYFGRAVTFPPLVCTYIYIYIFIGQLPPSLLQVEKEVIKEVPVEKIVEADA